MLDLIDQPKIMEPIIIKMIRVKLIVVVRILRKPRYDLASIAMGMIITNNY